MPNGRHLRGCPKDFALPIAKIYYIQAIDCAQFNSSYSNLYSDMKKKSTYISLFFLMNLIISVSLSGQNTPIIVEAEAGILGADFATEQDGEVGYITITSNAAGDSPQSEERVASLEVTFPAAQSYHLFVRCRVGSGNFNDDSFYYGNGFGEQSPSDGDAWVRVNNLSSTGYSGENEFVDGGGTTGTGVWKWINLSQFTGDETPLTFEVIADQLTQTLQIGGREDGLDIDKIAFGRADYFFTVSNLDNGTEGSPTDDLGPGTPPLADGGTKYLGNIYSPSQINSFEQYWNQVTPENAGKWGSVEGTRDNMNWAGMDAAYQLAKDNGFPVRFHVLIWGNQQPSWIENLPPNEQLEEIEEWFAAIAARYPDLDQIEVVNEPLHDPPNQAGSGGGNYIEALGGSGSSGWDWILESFRMARQYFPDARLMINDYNIVNSNTNTRRYREIIELLQEEDLIDEIGVQAHAFSTRGSTNQMRANLNTLAETGLPIYATEMDIDGPTDQEQLDDYQRIFPVFWEHPAVRGVTLWGYRPGLWRNEERAYLIGTDGSTERPALQWLRTYVSGTITSTYTQQSGRHISIYPNPVRGGEITVEGLPQMERAELYNLSGKRVWSDRLQGQTIMLNTDLPPGMYVLQLYAPGAAFAKRLIIGK